MNWEKKYLKYKIKYLELKNKSSNFFGGSSNSIDNILRTNNLELIEELGSGWNGTIFKVKNIDTQEEYILKIEKLDQYDLDNKLSSEYFRQVDFDEKISSLYSDKFMVLVNHGIIENCDYIHPKTDEVMEKANKVRKERFIRKNSQTSCYYLLYRPILDGTFRRVKDLIRNDEKLLNDFLIQIVESINLYRKKGFSHTDFGLDNIMYIKTGTKYKWYIIDYGNITNIDYPDSLLDLERLKENSSYKTLLVGDLLGFVGNFLISDDDLRKTKPNKSFFLN